MFWGGLSDRRILWMIFLVLNNNGLLRCRFGNLGLTLETSWTIFRLALKIEQTLSYSDRFGAKFEDLISAKCTKTSGNLQKMHSRHAYYNYFSRYNKTSPGLSETTNQKTFRWCSYSFTRTHSPLPLTNLSPPISSRFIRDNNQTRGEKNTSIKYKRPASVWGWRWASLPTKGFFLKEFYNSGTNSDLNSALQNMAKNVLYIVPNYIID